MMHVSNYVEGRQNTADLHICETLWADEGGIPAGQDGCDSFDIQILVHVDSSYPEQSSAKVDVWHQGDLAWHRVSHLIEVPVESYLKKRDAAYEAADELRARAATLLLGTS